MALVRIQIRRRDLETGPFNSGHDIWKLIGLRGEPVVELNAEKTVQGWKLEDGPTIGLRYAKKIPGPPIGTRQKRLSGDQEERTASDIGGRTQANSGATRLGGGGDVRGGSYRIECKFTEKDEYVLRFPELEKLRKQAFQTLEVPVFQFAFRARNGKLDSYAAIKWQGGEDKRQVILWEGGKTFTLAQEDLRNYLLSDQRIHVRFWVDGTQESFEVMRWDDFLATREAA